jgi:hypothetical protein
MINEELNYMKYLLGYQRGVIISEQKILLEQTKADYDQIASELTSAYGATLNKYGFNEIKLYGIDEKKNLTENYTGVPKVIGLKSNSPLTYYDKTYSEIFFNYPLGSGITEKFKNPVNFKLDSSPINSAVNDVPFSEAYREKYAKIDADNSKLRAAFDKATLGIATSVGDLITLKSKGEDITKRIEGIKKVESDAQQKTTTQQTTTKPGTTATTKPGTTAAKTTTQPGTTSGSGSNQYKDPIISVKDVQAGDEIFWTVEAFGYFETSSDTSGFGKILADKLRKEVFGNTKLQQLLKDPQKNVKNKIAITSMYIRGGASNRMNNSVTPAELSGLQKPLQRNATIKKITDETKNFTNNKTLATNRADGIWNYLKADLPKNAQKIRISNNISLKKEGYIVETGGVEDTSASRDWTKYPIPGQHVYISFTIELRPVVEPDKVQSRNNKCFWNCSVELSFGLHPGSANHSCDPAAFGVWANGVYIGHIDLGNSTLIISKRLTQKTQGVTGVSATKTTPTTNGDSVSGTLKITDESLAQKIIAASKSGEVEIKVKGDNYNDYRKRMYNADAVGTHAEIPWMRVTTSTGKIIYDNKANTAETLARCGGFTSYTDPCPNWSLGQFNPCATNKEDGALSKIAKKT